MRLILPYDFFYTDFDQKQMADIALHTLSFSLAPSHILKLEAQTMYNVHCTYQMSVKKRRTNKSGHCSLISKINSIRITMRFPWSLICWYRNTIKQINWWPSISSHIRQEENVVQIHNNFHRCKCIDLLMFISVLRLNNLAYPFNHFKYPNETESLWNEENEILKQKNRRNIIDVKFSGFYFSLSSIVLHNAMLMLKLKWKRALWSTR